MFDIQILIIFKIFLESVRIFQLKSKDVIVWIYQLQSILLQYLETSNYRLYV